MAQTKHEIQEALQWAKAVPRHRFGQNFMIDQNLVRLVADAAQLTRDDLVIEVGPGTGTLTQELLARAGDVLAVDIDPRLSALLRERFSSANFRLIEGDALEGKHGLNSDLMAAMTRAREAHRSLKLVANLPYNIASPLVVEMLLGGAGVLAFTVQKEVADRIQASASDEAYGPISIMIQLLASVEVLRTLPPQAFWPQPKVDSALVRLRSNDRLGHHARNFGRFIHSIFASRRKTLRKALTHAGQPPEHAEAAGFDLRSRAEELSPEQLKSLYMTTLTPAVTRS